MEKTTYTVQSADGLPIHIAILHADHCAIAYDFYIPSAIWDDQPVQMFLARLRSVENSATVFNGLTGVWQGEQECTRIYRVILRSGQFDRSNIRTTLQNEIGRLMADLEITPGHGQQAVLFTETEVRVSLSSQQQSQQ